MNALVNNLLDMARIESGEVKLRREWQPLEEVVGSALQAVAHRARQSSRRGGAAAGSALVEFDATLIERVLVQPAGECGASTRRQER